MSGCDSSVRRILRASKRFRSTKGASKARRDQINKEIQNMRALLPICAEEQERLSYLHSMALICTFIRKTVLIGGLHEDAAGVSPLTDGFLQALPGFIIAFTKDGKLVYVSENVQEYLGLSMVDVLQGDSFYDMMDSRDTEEVKVVLRDRDASAERSFVCRMHASKAFRLQNGSCCSMLVKGRFQDALFVALCTPTVDRLKDSELLNTHASFHTLHRPDMSLAHAPRSVLFHLGFPADELIGRSWYKLLHPDDLRHAADRHMSLIRADGNANAEMLIRLQRKDLSWSWIYICAAVKAAKESIACTNHVISETEAVYLKDKLCSNARTSPSVCGTPLSQSRLSRTPRETRSKTRTSSETSDSFSGTDGENSSSSATAFFSTPPYSPTSSLSSDFLSEGYSAFEQLVCDSRFCPSRSSPDVASQAFPLIPYLDPFSALHPVCPPDARLVPAYGATLDACEGSSDCVLHPEDFSSFPLIQEELSSLITPEPSPTAGTRFLYSETEQAEIGTLALQIHSLACSFDAYSTTPHAQPARALCWPPTQDPLLDETVIDSILRDLDVAKPDCVWNRLPVDSVTLEPLVRHTGPEPHQLQRCLYGVHQTAASYGRTSAAFSR